MTKNQGMFEVAVAYLEKNEHATFYQLWNEVVHTLKHSWKEDNPHKKVSDIESKKRAVFYTMLTLHGAFLRTLKGRWVLINRYSTEEVKKLQTFYEETADSTCPL